MVLNQNEVVSRKDILTHSHNYLVLDSRHIKNQYNHRKFELAIELLNICNTVNWVNEIFAETDPDRQIEYDVLYKAIDHIIQDKPFNEDQIIEYYKVIREIEYCGKLLSNFTDFYEEIWFPNIDLILLGFPLEEQEVLQEPISSQLFDFYAEEYDKLRVDIDPKDLSDSIKNIKRTIQNNFFEPVLSD